MFYSTQILSKKGPLGTIWIASHLEKRLKRSQIFETSIPASVGESLQQQIYPYRYSLAARFPNTQPDCFQPGNLRLKNALERKLFA